jgi:hypothetical protein
MFHAPAAGGLSRREKTDWETGRLGDWEISDFKFVVKVEPRRFPISSSSRFRVLSCLLVSKSPCLLV